MRAQMLIAAILGAAMAGQALGQPQPQTSKRERILKAVELPKKANEVRSQGVPSGEVKEALDAAKAKGLPADEMSDVTDEQSKAIKEHGRIDNFGAFVKSKLNEGLRGRDLAAAIRAEHARRGMGKPSSKAKADKDERDRQEKAKEDRDRGKPDKDKGKPEKERGKPEKPGKGG